MTLNDAEIISIREINKAKSQGFIEPDWQFKWTRSRLVFGLCDYEKFELKLSNFFVPHMNEQQIHDTILHEIAHAMCDWADGHGPTWLEACRVLGLENTEVTAEYPGESEENLYRYVIRQFNKPVKWYINRPAKKILEKYYPVSDNYVLAKLV